MTQLRKVAGGNSNIPFEFDVFSSIVVLSQVIFLVLILSGLHSIFSTLIL